MPMIDQRTCRNLCIRPLPIDPSTNRACVNRLCSDALSILSGAPLWRRRPGAGNSFLGFARQPLLEFDGRSGGVVCARARVHQRRLASEARAKIADGRMRRDQEIAGQLRDLTQAGTEALDMAGMVREAVAGR